MRASPLLAAALLCAGIAAAEEGPSRVVLRWQSVQGAAGYDLQVAKDAAFTARELEVRVELAGYRLGPPPTSGRRYWRVRTVDADGRPGPWSSAKVIEPVAAGPEPSDAPPPVPSVAVLDVPPLLPAPVPPLEPVGAELADDAAPAATRAGEEPPSSPPRDAGLEGPRLLGMLQAARPGIVAGWRANLLGVTAPTLGLEVAAPFLLLGTGWRAALRAGWWRETTEVPTSTGLEVPLGATADVVPIGLMLLRELERPWARLYVGAGVGTHLVVIRQGSRGSLDASGALEAVVGAGRPFGPGEPFVELSGGLGGVDGPLGRLRTGGISLSVGYRLR